ncbi:MULTISPECIES: hypothetical protein [unclassified Rickettsia]|uniref:hypothetical protein n=1 Tax=unclassified Rickettsia TaxID=114295 RepID=UPI00209FC1B7|nr:hypothetical protein [Rickettsia endosymbiont of Ceutorhynchus assimilis]
MNKDSNAEHKNDEYTEALKKINSKLMSLSGNLLAMRSDNSEEQKKISNDLKALVKQLNSIKRNVEMYFIAMLLLVIIVIQKMLWTGATSNLFFS